MLKEQWQADITKIKNLANDLSNLNQDFQQKENELITEQTQHQQTNNTLANVRKELWQHKVVIQ